MTPQDIKERCEFAKKLARRAGQNALQFRAEQGRSGLSIENKGPQDFVTIADKNTEDLIKAALAESYPEDGFLGEETGGISDDGPVWVVDPIDGTANYMRGLHYWAVSIAFVYAGEVRAGVIYDAPHDEIFWAIKDQGSFKENKRLEANRNSDPTTSLAILGYGRITELDEHIDLISAVHSSGMEFRNNGAAAIDLIRVAEGAADMCYVHVLRAWDALAGLLIAAEAGASGYSLPPLQFMRESGSVLCGSVEATNVVLNANPKLTADLVPFGGVN